MDTAMVAVLRTIGLAATIGIRTDRCEVAVVVGISLCHDRGMRFAPDGASAVFTEQCRLKDISVHLCTLQLIDLNAMRACIFHRVLRAILTITTDLRFHLFPGRLVNFVFPPLAIVDEQTILISCRALVAHWFIPLLRFNTIYIG